MFLTENPLANMYGPYFLLFYGTLFVVFCLVAAWYNSTLDHSGHLPPVPVPENPNPYEIAYLRGGEAEVARLMVLELFQRGILEETPKRLLQTTKLRLSPHVDLEALDPNLRKMAATFQIARDPNPSDANRVRVILSSQLDTWSKWVVDQQLLYNVDQRDDSYRFVRSLLVAFAVLGSYKLVVSLLHGHHNVIFLCLMLLFGSLGLMAFSRLPRFTQRGRRYVDNLQAAYSAIKSGEMPKPDQYQPGAAEAAWDPLLVGSYAMPVMAMGLFGASALQSEHYRRLQQQYSNSADGSGCSSTSCSSGCSAASSTSSASSCSSGDGGGAGGCGGGGGGCGGGGCGGCGGG